MYSKTALSALFPHLNPDTIELKSVKEVPFGDRPLYGEILDSINKVLVRDPVTGRAENIVSYLLKHSDKTSEFLQQFLVRKVSEASPKLSDDEALELLSSRYCQTPAEVAQISSVLEEYLSRSIKTVSKEVPPVPDVAPSVDPSAGSSE